MQRLLNAPENYVDEMLDGIYAAHPELVTYTADDKRCLVSRYKKPGKVGIATGGGSGHLPLFLGYVGEGMADGCSIGNVFQSPSAEQMLEATASSVLPNFAASLEAKGAQTISMTTVPSRLAVDCAAALPYTLG